MSEYWQQANQETKAHIIEHVRAAITAEGIFAPPQMEDIRTVTMLDEPIPSVRVHIDTRKAQAELDALIAENLNAALIHRASQLLRLSPEDAADWLVAKIAAFRGCAESDIAAEMGIDI